jgi:hypothetical protein
MGQQRVCVWLRRALSMDGRRCVDGRLLYRIEIPFLLRHGLDYDCKERGNKF